MYPTLKNYCDRLSSDFGSIPEDRKKLLAQITSYIVRKQKENTPVNLVYICTHNSRRSHFGQIWAKVAAEYYGIQQISTYSGGTEATAFNLNAIAALQRVGFKIESDTENNNPHYRVFYDEQSAFIDCFSKVYDHPKNPQKNFAAIMTCSDAEENCPFIPGVELRIGTTYDDPKAFDHTELQDEKYDERCRQIAIETFYVFSLIPH